jgi:hypothetical protein
LPSDLPGLPDLKAGLILKVKQVKTTLQEAKKKLAGTKPASH